MRFLYFFLIRAILNKDKFAQIRKIFVEHKILNIYHLNILNKLYAPCGK